MTKSKFNRRNFLARSSSAALMSPVLSSLAGSRALAQEAKSGMKYVVMIDLGFGSYDSLFYPQPETAPNFQDTAQNVKMWNTKDVIGSSKMFAGTALERVADNVSIYQGLDRHAFHIRDHPGTPA